MKPTTREFKLSLNDPHFPKKRKFTHGFSMKKERKAQAESGARKSIAKQLKRDGKKPDMTFNSKNGSKYEFYILDNKIYMVQTKKFSNGETIIRDTLIRKGQKDWNKMAGFIEREQQCTKTR